MLVLDFQEGLGSPRRNIPREWGQRFGRFDLEILISTCMPLNNDHPNFLFVQSD
jgi:hypothetical protein